MTPMNTYSFAEEPTGALYDGLLGIAANQAARVGLIVQKRNNPPAGMHRVLDMLHPYVVKVEDVTEWPGSRLLATTQERRVYQLTDPVKRILTQVARGLFDWENPDLPDDLHVMRADDSTWLGSIAHEADAWLELTSAELAEISLKAPSIAAILRRDGGPIGSS